MQRVFSFDVFDTVLTRNVFAPKEVFSLVQKRIGEASGKELSRLSKTFRGGRVLAEFYARRRAPRDDIRLVDIYQVLAEWYSLTDGQQRALMDVELFVEETTLLAIDGAREHVSRRRAEGQVVFISDMYLPHDFIKGVLERHGLFESNDKLYVSGEHGFTKGSGKLFKKVLEDCSIAAQDLTHVGDNPVSDLAVPVSLGVNFDYSFGVPVSSGSRFEHWRQRAHYLFELLQARIYMQRGLDV